MMALMMAVLADRLFDLRVSERGATTTSPARRRIEITTSGSLDSVRLALRLIASASSFPTARGRSRARTRTGAREAPQTPRLLLLINASAASRRRLASAAAAATVFGFDGAAGSTPPWSEFRGRVDAKPRRQRSGVTFDVDWPVEEASSSRHRADRARL